MEGEIYLLGMKLSLHSPLTPQPPRPIGEGGGPRSALVEYSNEGWPITLEIYSRF